MRIASSKPGRVEAQQGVSIFEVSSGAAALHPRLPAALMAQGLAQRAGSSLRIVASGENGGDIVVARSDRAGITRCAAIGRLCLTFGPDDTAFAVALIAAAARDDAMPAGAAPSSLALFDLAARVARGDVGILIAGPTGTGKEGLARLIHARSPRSNGPFVAVNCAAIPETMLEATLFGYERGAFTGAVAGMPGLFRAANGGTLLLDEVTELPLALQAKLLRALEEREVLPVGAAVPVRTDARIIATANRDVAGEVSAGHFRADLFYRLAVFPLTTTALVDRPDDIVPIAAALWLEQGLRGWPTAAALAKLVAHDWPGNVRELGNVIARAAILAEGPVTPAAILFDPVVTSARTLGSTVRQHESTMIRATLAACAGRRNLAAQRLGISERTLRYKLAAMENLSKAVTLQ